MDDRSGSTVIFLDKAFSNEIARSSILSIQLNPRSIIFTVFHPASNHYIGFAYAQFGNSGNQIEVVKGLKEFIDENEWVAFPYKNHYLLIQNHFSTLIPLSLFEESDSRSYLEFNQPLPGEWLIRHDVLKNTDSINVYGLDEQLDIYLKNIFPSAVIRHFSSVFIETIALNFKNLMDNRSVFLNVRDEYFDLLYFKEGQLVFYNLFRYKTKEDFIYFLLAALEQLALNPEEIRLYLLGEVDLHDRLHEIIYRYVRDIDLIKKNETYSYAADLDAVKHHRYYVLYNLLQCVS